MKIQLNAVSVQRKERKAMKGEQGIMCKLLILLFLDTLFSMIFFLTRCIQPTHNVHPYGAGLLSESG